MRKNFGVKTWAYPMPVYIVAAYDKEGVPCCMNADTSDFELTKCEKENNTLIMNYKRK